MSWDTVIGLEVHVQLATRSKMFCGCGVVTGAAPNTHVCPVCLGLPGALPVTNAAACRLAVRAALALGATVHADSVFARKHYFYPDLPKGYQISQFDAPLASRGRLTLRSPERGQVTVRINRIHLEEDAGKSVHDRGRDRTSVDFNRAGTPLVEIVTEPDVRSPGEARGVLTALKEILEYLEVSDCNMEEGHLRADANLSIRPAGTDVMGVKQEIKNMNSFAAVERSLSALRERQVATVEAGGTVEPATYGAGTGELRLLREKEAQHDYRYFPDPDLPPLRIPPAFLEEERAAVGELPEALRARLRREYGISAQVAAVLTGAKRRAGYFEAVVAAGADPGSAARWVMGPVLEAGRDVDAGDVVPAPRVAELIGLVADGVLSYQAAKKVFRAMTSSDASARDVAAHLGLIQVSGRDRLAAWVDEVLEGHPDEVERFRAGEHRLLGFFMGQVMKASGGRADPAGVRKALADRLG